MPASSQEKPQPAFGQSPAVPSLESRTGGKPLFSQHWLINRLPEEPEWAEDALS